MVRYFLVEGRVQKEFRAAAAVNVSESIGMRVRAGESGIREGKTRLGTYVRHMVLNLWGHKEHQEPIHV